MVAEETSSENAFETTLTAEMGPTDLTAAVVTKGTLTTPSILTIEPDDDAQREIIRFNGTFGASSFVTQNVSFRYLPGSAAGSGLTHPSGSIVRSTPTAQHFEDINDRVDALDHGADLAGLSDDDHTQYHNDARGDARYVELAGDTMTGLLTLSGDPDAALKAATKQYVDRIAADDVLASETRASTTFGDLATVGPAVTIVTGDTALVTVSANISNDTAGAFAVMGYAITGATSKIAGDAIALVYQSPDNDREMQASWSSLRKDLTPGTNTFTCKYRACSNVMKAGRRNITVEPKS